ncbi:Cas8a1 family CRISPR/Cas system-associated protein [Ureibacillus terrenus]|nr:Cas8a1 family CRISPR/Cas system-associated protein [Ureibacillus terrenus]MED3660530.1 Cas8a1 family CRISPR/Cas system-associated protein [Ureibacillus terrenus]MED3763899.1 Cas8a1 family CRISPR/Cas system-associated protein [Ureibacillus terrenus]
MIKLTLDDALYNAAILGLCRIFDHAGLPYERDGQSIEFDETNLENFSEKYFNYLIAEYGHDTNYAKLINSNVGAVKDAKHLERLNEIIDNFKKTLSSNSYKNTYPFLTEVNFDFLSEVNKLKRITLKKKQTIEEIQPNIQEMLELISNIIAHLRHPQAKRYLVPRILSYNLIQGFWTNVSFLHKTANKKDIYKTYDEYFTNAALNFLEKKKDEKKYEKNKFHCATCENKMSTVSEAFDLTWLQRIGVDAARKSSHYWDHQRDIFICPVCNLVYSCLPFGFRIVKGKGFFINNNRSVDELISVNSVSLGDGQQEVTRDELESMAYYKIIDFMVNQTESRKDLEIENIQIVKYDRDMESRPYTYNILSRHKLMLIDECKKEFQHLVGKFAKLDDEYISLYQEVINRLYKGQSFTDLIYRLIRQVIDGKYNNITNIYYILKISNHQYKGGVHFMQTEELNKVRSYGFYLKKAYASQETKLNGISYRLLNALKVKNPSKFMETLLQAYSYKKMEIPSIFVQILNDERKFETIGYAFLLGLHGYEGNTDKEEIKHG